MFDAPTTSEGSPIPKEAAASGPVGESTDARASNPRLVLGALLGALTIGAIAVALAIGGTGGTGGVTIDGPGTVAGAATTNASDGPGGEIVVAVGGAVVTPGVYRLRIGARVGDAIAAAGGFSPRVDANRVGAELNLAALVSDGGQIRVPSRDDAVATAGAGGGSAAGGGSGAGPGGKPVNLNTATEAELDSLPGIGPVTAGKIVESRTKAPFRTVDELRERGLVGQKTFDAIRALVTVG